MKHARQSTLRRDAVRFGHQALWGGVAFMPIGLLVAAYGDARAGIIVGLTGVALVAFSGVVRACKPRTGIDSEFKRPGQHVDDRGVLSR